MEKVNIDLEKQNLRKFILEASRATYASGNESIKEKQPDGSTTIEYHSGEYKFHDNYFGGEPYGGREVIFKGDRAIWMMVYYGFVNPEVSTKEVYNFLMASLSISTIDMPYRGPKFFEKDGWKYINEFSGELERFSGIEKIYKDGVCVYEANYIGGDVNK